MDGGVFKTYLLCGCEKARFYDSMEDLIEDVLPFAGYNNCCHPISGDDSWLGVYEILFTDKKKDPYLVGLDDEWFFVEYDDNGWPLYLSNPVPDEDDEDDEDDEGGEPVDLALNDPAYKVNLLYKSF